jgi:ribonuclease BN (tRNA processing enzyme)
VQVTVVGCSPAWPNPGGAQSGYLVDGRVLLDCGPGVLGRLRTQNGSWPEVDAIVITHFHLDHWGDVVPWVWGRMFGLGKDLRVPELWVPPDGTKELELFGGTFGTPWMFDRTFTVHEYPEDEPFTVSGLELRAVRVPHYTLRTYALRVTDGDRVLAYSGDSGPSNNLAEVARDADLFICEATLERGELDGDLRGHLSADEALVAYRDSGARRLLLTHRPKELPLDNGLEQAYDGLVVDV